MNKNLFRQLFSVFETQPRLDYSFESQNSTKEVLFIAYGWLAT